jgi:AcrR family transcriptional regulator
VASTADASLRERLIETALQVLAERRTEELTMRKLAARTGVSHGAPLRHFSGFAELLTAVAARGFELLGERVELAASSLPVGAGPRARLAAASRAYVSTAIEHPDLFALMYRFDLLETEHPEYQRHAGNAFRHFVRCVQAVQDAGTHPDRDTLTLNAVLWSQVHGIAALWSHGALGASLVDTTLDDVIDLAMELLLPITTE